MHLTIKKKPTKQKKQHWHHQVRLRRHQATHQVWHHHPLPARHLQMLHLMLHVCIPYFIKICVHSFGFDVHVAIQIDAL